MNLFVAVAGTDSRCVMRLNARLSKSLLLRRTAKCFSLSLGERAGVRAGVTFSPLAQIVPAIADTEESEFR